jgi:hypothetical protein
MPEPRLTDDEIRIIAESEQLFDRMCQERHDMGRTKYGTLTFLEMPTLHMALEEIADLANYARYTFVKVALLQWRIKQLQNKAVTEKDGFHSTSEVLGVTKEL